MIIIILTFLLLVVIILIILKYIINNISTQGKNKKCKNKKCVYDKDCENSKCCINYKCDECPSEEGPIVNNINDPKIKSFMEYLENKMETALSKYVIINAGGSLKDPLTKNSSISLGIYIKNTPDNRGAVKVSNTYLGNLITGNIYNKENGEPSYYFGSGTKPLTSAMVVGQLYKLWRKNNPQKDINEFITWYTGNEKQPGAPPSLTYKDLFNLTNGFENSNFTETLTRKSNTQAKSTGNPITKPIKDWLFCCPNDKNSLLNKCESPGLFCSNTCKDICPIPLDSNTYGGTCQSPFCPTNMCNWAWYADYTGETLADKDPNELKFVSGVECTCSQIEPNEFQNILQNLSIFDVTMMRSGIPDSDAIWGMDTSAQLSSRTSSIGPVEFVSEIVGFDWNPLWKKDENDNYVPINKSLEFPMTFITKNQAPSNYPPSQYSSSAYTFLGILLWLLYEQKTPTDWSKIDLNQLLPRKLRKNINFAGTEGNNGKQYFNKDQQGNRYYSFEKTVSLGNIPHSGTIEDTPIQSINMSSTPEKDLSGIIPTTFTRTLPDKTTTKFLDWDSSSGVSCGNGWGKTSDMAEIYMNILSPNADNPIIGDKELQKIYANKFLNYNGDNWKNLWNNKIRAPFCLAANAWGQNYTYNCGIMGPDWFYMYDSNSSQEYGIIPCYGHLGSTYGFNSGHAYFPGGTIKPWPPYSPLTKSGNAKYSSPDWSLTFKFCGENEFTISQAHNDSGDDQSGAIQLLIQELINDPFDWNS